MQSLVYEFALTSNLHSEPAVTGDKLAKKYIQTRRGDSMQIASYHFFGNQQSNQESAVCSLQINQTNLVVFQI